MASDGTQPIDPLALDPELAALKIIHGIRPGLSKPRPPKPAKFVWSDAPTCVVVAPACPSCGCTETPITLRSEVQTDGTTVRKSVCRECSIRFRLIVALPSFGNEHGGVASPGEQPNLQPLQIQDNKKQPSNGVRT